MFLLELLILPIFPMLGTPYRYLPEDDGQKNIFSGNGKFHRYLADPTEVPHHVLVLYGTVYCSGSLVASKIVVTAASCFHKLSGEDVHVKVGSDNIVSPGGQPIYRVVEIKQHEFYEHLNLMDNDIALLVLEKDVIFGPEVEKVILVDPDMALRIGSIIDVTGWASTDLPPKLLNKMVRSAMEVIERRECRSYLNGYITPSNYCARYSPDRRLSDNGGSAIYMGLLVGILSFGANTKEEPTVAVITNVSFFHRWITLNIKRLLLKHCVARTQTYSSSEYYEDDGDATAI